MSKIPQRSALAAFVATVVASGGFGSTASAANDNDQGNDRDLREIQTIVVIYAENRSFDNLFGAFPGANGLSRASGKSVAQLDRDGSVLKNLPAVWGGTDGADPTAPSKIKAAITAGAPPAPQPLTETQTGTYFSLNKINHPFSLLSLYGSASFIDTNPLQYTNRDLYHRFYENQMQINGGANNMFAAWADSGGLVMMYIPNNNDDHPLWNLARKNVLADNFFQSAFGGSYLNHQFLICSCAPIYPGDGTKPVNPTAGGSAPAPSVLNADGVTLTTTVVPPPSALMGPPTFVASTTATPAIHGINYSINTMQPPFPPSGNANTTTPPQQSVNAKSASTLPPQTQTTIGDLLSAAGVDWAYYSGAWNFALSNAPFSSGTSAANPNFQYHHQPFNYFVAFDPSTNAGAANRAAHLKDAGVSSPTDVANAALPDSTFRTDILNGNLPAVTFYKPNGTVNEHNGYANVTDGDRHIAAVVDALQHSPQYRHMVIVITYDENGGIWDHVAPPKGDMFGPGSRIPAIIVSPFAKHGVVDHTQYDTTSILRLITRRWQLPVLDGIKTRDAALVKNGYPPMGDLTNALDFENDQGDDNQGGRGNDNEQ
jgi:phospholipase C